MVFFKKRYESYITKLNFTLFGTPILLPRKTQSSLMPFRKLSMYIQACMCVSLHLKKKKKEKEGYNTHI